MKTAKIMCLGNLALYGIQNSSPCTIDISFPYSIPHFDISFPYSIPRSHSQVPTSREPETLMQRYHRLKQEVGELLADVAQITEAQRSSEKMMEVSPADLAQDVSPGPTCTG